MFKRFEGTGIEDIAERVFGGERISVEDGIRLFHAEDLHAVGMLAHHVRLKKNGKKAYYIKNKHINYSNVCLNSCRFCAFSRRPGEDGAYAMTVDEILEEARTAAPGTTEVHIVGGCHVDRPFEYYLEMVSRLHEEFPGMHIQAFTAVEIAHIAERGDMSVRECLVRLKEAGLGSLPGGGAEIFHPRVREAVCPEKLPGDDWLRVAGEAHKLGIRSNATMLYGHVETIEERVDHMAKLRSQQDETGGFMSFIPLAFHPENTRMADLNLTAAADDLRTMAVARLMLDNFDHMKAFWIMLTVKLSQVSLFYGADDLNGTVVRERITHSAGARTPEAMTVERLVRLAGEAGFSPIERDTVYNEVWGNRS